MSKLAGWLLVIALCVVPAVPSYASGGHSGGHGGFHGGFHHGGFHHGGGFHGSVFIGGPWWGGPWWWGPAYVYPYPYWYYPYAYAPYPPASVEGSSVYIQKPSGSSEQAEGYWYYCESAKVYYPYVDTCPEAWIKVPPAPQ